MAQADLSSHGSRGTPPPLRTRYDQLAKRALHELLTAAGPVETEKEVTPDPQRIDLWFAPASPCATQLIALGLLGRIAARPCTLEAFHNPPGPTRVAACVRKHIHLCHHLAGTRSRPRLPRTWILSAGRPASVLEGYAYRRAPGWPTGIYVSPPLLRMGIVVISELPERRDTLILRLLGAGPTLRRAIDELKALPEDALERRVMLPLLVKLRFTVPASSGKQTADDKEFMMSTQDAMALWEQRVVDRTLSPARSLLLRLYEMRFSTAPDTIRTLVEATNDPEQITQWLELAATGAQEEVDRVFAAAPPPPPVGRRRRRAASSR